MRVLIVEDEAPLRVQLAACLRQQGYAVDEAEDGKVGLYTGQEYSSMWRWWISACPIYPACS